MHSLPRRSSTRILTALVTTGGLVAAGAGTASADLIGNSLDDSIESTAELMPVNLGSSGTTQLYVLAADGDGNPGCNFDRPGESLTVSLTSSAPGIATVQPASVTFTSCTDSKTVTVTPLAEGRTTIRGVVPTGGNTTGGQVVTNGIAFVAEVTKPAPANTAPTIRVAGVASGASYTRGSVPPATCEVSDAEDGPSTFPARLSEITGPYAVDSLGTRYAFCSYVDGGGLQVLDRQGFQIVDATAPVVGRVLDPGLPEAGWYRGDVSLHHNVVENQSFSSLRTSGCEDVHVTTDQKLGTYTCTATSAGGTTTVTTNLRRDATPPTVTSASEPVGTPGHDGWFTSPVSTTFSATDATSGLAVSSQTVTSTADGAAVTVPSPVFTDRAGNATEPGALASRPVKIDTQAPRAPEVVLSAPAVGGWHRDDVTVTFRSAGDLGPSGVASCTAPVVVSTETAGQTVSGTCTDAAGNLSAAEQVTVRLDRTAPTVAQTVAEVGTPGADGWYTSDVDVTFSAGDSGSGLAGGSARTTSTGEGAAVRVLSPAFTDAAGNRTAAGAVTKTYRIDKSRPAVPVFVGGPSGSHLFDAVPAAPTCTSTDAVSGLASCVVTGGGSSVGKHSYTATATDRAGHSSTAVLAYEVLPWTPQGFTSPVDMGGVLNTVKGGSTVPAKFELFAGSRELTDLGLVTLTNRRITCADGAAVDDIEAVVTGSTSLRYDTTAGQYHYNWKLPTGPGTCYALTMTAKDGSSITASFKLK